MTQALLRTKLRQAIEDMLAEAIDESKLNDDIQEDIRIGIRREAEKKSTRIHEYLSETVFSKLAELEGRIADLEERIETLGSAGPTSTPGSL